jgi:tight adherence protein C
MNIAEKLKSMAGARPGTQNNDAAGEKKTAAGMKSAAVGEKTAVAAGSKAVKLWQRYKVTILCILGGLVIYLLMVLLDPSGSRTVTAIDRKSYGKGNDNVKLYVEGLADEAVQVSIPVSSQKYTDEELEQAFARCLEELPEQMLGGNESLEHITQDLTLPESTTVPGISAKWTSMDKTVLKSDGRVLNEELTEPVETSLLAELTDGSRHELYTIPVKIYPRQYSSMEKLLGGLLEDIAREDQESVTLAHLNLPTQYLGRKITFKTKPADYSYIWILGIIAGILFILRDKENEKKAGEERELQMQIDYPEIVSKLMIFVGAGLSVRSSIESIAHDYKKQNAGMRHAYEQMCILSNKLNSGVSESAAYTDMGRSSKGKQYMKLAGLLEQNRRSGLSDLGILLEAEMREAWEERKNLARRMGEEASTKLLLPLLMMLVLVMIVIMYPALMSF